MYYFFHFDSTQYVILVCVGTGTSEVVETKVPNISGEQKNQILNEEREISNLPKPANDDAVSTSETETPAPSASSGNNPLMSRMSLNDNKAGMQGLDKERINQIIYETSKGNL